jgi:hypothetical protein
MQISGSLPAWERLWRKVLELANGLTEGMIWQGILRTHRQPEDVRRHADILSQIKGLDGRFFHELAQYPEWMLDSHMRSHVCSWVQVAWRINEETVGLNIRGHKYVLCFSRRPCDAADGQVLHRHGLLTLSVNRKEVLRLKLLQDEEGRDAGWHEVDIDTFVPGTWISKLRDLKEQIAAEGCARNMGMPVQAA